MSYLPVDVFVDQKARQKHSIDTLNLLAYSSLLIIVLLTSWFFKKRGRLYIHETGIAIIYGMIMGATLRYFGLEITISSQTIEDFIPNTAPADYMIVKARNLADKSNKTHMYAYEFKGELQAPAKLGSQISYAAVDPEVFFNIILPPIVLNAGLSLKRRHFFRNIGAIFTYAFLGTTISVAFVGGIIYFAINQLKTLLGYTYLADQFSLANCLYFGAIISPTDPLAVLAIFQELGVDVNLFALVFGESILNDAVSIVLTHSIDQFTIIYGRNPYYPLLSIIWQCVFNFLNMFFSSCLIGMAFGVVTALTTKFAHLGDNPLLETSLVVLTSYSAHLTAEALDVSGIVAILLCGITQAHYTINNMAFESRERLKSLFEMMNFLCENFLFLAVGVSFWQRQTWNLPFIGIAFVACIVARIMSVYPLTGLLNLGRRKEIPMSFQHVMAWGGMARGVISYSLAAKKTIGDAHRIMLSTTSVIVIVSVIVVGGSVDSLLTLLKIPTRASKELALAEEANLMNGGGASKLKRSDAVASTPRVRLDLTNTPHEFEPTPVSAPVSAGNKTPAAGAAVVEFAGQRRPTVAIAQEVAPSPAMTIIRGSERLNSMESSMSSGGRIDSCASLVANDDDVQSFGGPRLPAAATTTPGGGGACRHEEEPSLSSPYENASLVRRWRNVDNNFIKPLLTNSQPSLMETLPESLRALARLFTSDEQLLVVRHDHNSHRRRRLSSSTAQNPPTAVQ